MGSIDKLVAEAQRLAADDRIGYDQARRTTATGIDCSDLVRRCMAAGGFDTPAFLWTGNMHTELTARGWSWHPGTQGLQRGDILWKTGHTAVAVGGGARAEAWIDERGQTSGGRPGDQTGQEVRVHAPWNDIAWEGFFHAPTTPTTPPQEGLLMALSDTKQQAVYDRIMSGIPGKLARSNQRVLDDGDGNALRLRIEAATAQLAALTAAVEALAASQGLDGPAITHAITDAVHDALAGLEVTLATKETA